MRVEDLSLGAVLDVEGPLPGGESIGKQRARVISRSTVGARDVVEIEMLSDGFRVAYLAQLLAASAELAPPDEDGGPTSKLGRGGAT